MSTQNQTMQLRPHNLSASGTGTERGSAQKRQLTNRRSLVLLLAGLALLPYGARSELISMDDSQFGPGTITLDTRTGLRWLDLTFSAGMSYDYVSSQMGPGGLFAGFRHATSPEVESLFVSADIPDIHQGYQPSFANIAPAISLLSLIGPTFSQNGYPGAVAYTSTTTYGPTFRDAESLYCTVTGDGQEFVVGLGGGAIGSYSSPSVAQWMVAIPEPACGLLACGVLAMVVFRRALRFDKDGTLILQEQTEGREEEEEDSWAAHRPVDASASRKRIRAVPTLDIMSGGGEFFQAAK